MGCCAKKCLVDTFWYVPLVFDVVCLLLYFGVCWNWGVGRVMDVVVYIIFMMKKKLMP